MNVKRYFAKTAREALRALKAELGADAIVLSNRAVEGGVEILALPAEAVGAMQQEAEAAPVPRRALESAPTPRRQHAAAVAAYQRSQEQEEDDFSVRLSAAPPLPQTPRRRPATGDASPRLAKIRPFSPPRIQSADCQQRRRSPYDPLAAVEPRSAHMTGEDMTRQLPRREPELCEAPEIDPPAATRDGTRDPLRRAADEERIRSLEEANGRLMQELSGIRGLIERQLAGFAWADVRRNAPAQAEIVGELLEAGFAAPMVRELAKAADGATTLNEARTAVRNALARDLRAMSSDADLIDRGGVYALVGATGVGKTTTTAKIAARCVVRHGAAKLALITTDGYRIGAQEQLRIYGRILGVPVFQVRDGHDLRQTLAELRNKHMVLIDTVGMSQRDRMVAEQIAMLAGIGQVRRLLLLNATCRGDTLDDVVRAYGGADLAGCVLTKVDETLSLAPALGAAIQHRLEVFYVANGQRVPEDLHLPNRAYLLHRALRPGMQESPAKLKRDEATLMMATARIGC